MQKPAAASKIIDIDTTTAFVSHMSDYFLETVMMKWNTLIIISIKTQIR